MAGKYTEVTALQKLHTAGAEALEPYSGNMSEKWACRCLKCGSKIFPRMASIDRGSKACRYCYGPNPVDPDKAEADMIAAGLKPLEPYPGYDRAWGATCITCGRETVPQYKNIAKGGGSCRWCNRAKQLNRVDSETAKADMSRSTKVLPRAVANRANHSNRADSEKAKAVMLAKGVEVLERYPGYDKPWKVRCLSCGSESSPTYGNVKKGQGACRWCNRPNRVDPEKAEAAMLAKGVEILEPYPGYAKPWKVRCLTCGSESSPAYANIKKGQGACSRCANDYGDLPAFVYLVHDSVRQVVKVGITNEHAHRLRKYAGWIVVDVLETETGREAARIESEILRHWRIDLQLKPKLSRREMPHQGYTETADGAGLLPALAISRRYKNKS